MPLKLIQGKQIATASWAQNAVSASYSATASYALNAGGTTIDTGSFATTGSNIFIGNQTVTGSVTATQGFTTNWGTDASRTALFGVDYPAGVNNRQILFNDISNNDFNYQSQSIGLLANVEEGFGVALGGNSNGTSIGSLINTTLNTSTIQNTSGTDFGKIQIYPDQLIITTDNGTYEQVLQLKSDNINILNSDKNTSEENFLRIQTYTTYSDKYIETGEGFVGNYLEAPSITGSLLGTASFAVSSSRAISSSFATTASFATTSSFAQNATTSSYPISVEYNTLYSTNPPAGTPYFDVILQRPSNANSIFLGNQAGFSASDADGSNFLGTSAGAYTTASNSNFLGPQAGQNATNANNSNFLGPQAGQNATNANYSNFLGNSAGRYASGANYSNFLGQSAGYEATNAGSSNFLGPQAGQEATNASNSNFLGSNAGIYASGASYSNFLGNSAGYQATNASNSNFLGSGAGYQANSANNSNFLGNNAGRYASGADYSNFLGPQAGQNATNAGSSNFLGNSAGYEATNAGNSNFLGFQAGYQATNASSSNFLGYQAGFQANSANNSNFLGNNAGRTALNASYSTLIGYNVGNNGSGTRTINTNNIIIGTNISLPSQSRHCINLGGLIFATGSYSTTTGNAFSSSVVNGRVGINTFNPQYNLHVSGSIFASTFISSSFTGSLFGTASYALNGLSASFAVSASRATTASYALNGGVTQLLAGPNITLSPTDGLGQVTISSTSDGGGFNTATGSYGSFYDTTTQTNPVANMPRSMSLNRTDITNGVSVSGSTNPFNTYIKTQNAGVYNIQFSAQLDKTDSGADEIVIWLRKNGIDLTDTATTVTLTGNNGKEVAAWNWFTNSAANDYYQIIWQSADTSVRLFAEPADGHPGIPSVIVTANRVDQFLSNTGSFSGSFTGQFTGSLLGTGPISLFKDILSTGSINYTLQQQDTGRILHFTSSTATTITIPLNLQIGSRFEGKQLGTGQLSFVTGSGVTIRTAATENTKTAEQYSVFAIDWIGAEEYMLYGRLEQA